jgi:hypothetical protein
MTYSLLRGKVLDKFRLDGDMLVAIDGVNVLTLKRMTDVPCITQQHADGQDLYMYNALEAKIVTCTGLAIHVATAFIDYQEPNATKQDCETKAFYRLAEILKNRYGRTSMCLMAD